MQSIAFVDYTYSRYGSRDTPIKGSPLQLYFYV